MKKLLCFALLLSSATSSYGMYEYYQQQSELALYTTDEQTNQLVQNILDQFGLEYLPLDEINPKDDVTLHIIAGDLSGFVRADLPKHYIAYQTEPLHGVSATLIEVLRDAYAVWDVHLSNLSAYRGHVYHWYHLPSETYAYIDPIVLPCLLPLTALPSYRDLLVYSNVRDTEISSHLPALFCHCYLQNPEMLVEAGVWGGESTIALSKIPHLLENAYMIGLDIDNYSGVYAGLKNAHFVQMNDTEFPAYFKTLDLGKDKVDFVFIDTSHLYHHTLTEINAFSSVLSEAGALGFHDSNVAAVKPVRINGSVCPDGIALGNTDGVTRGIKTYFNIAFDENKYFNVMVEKDGYLWNLVHYPYCYGMTIAKRVQTLN